MHRNKKSHCLVDQVQNISWPLFYLKTQAEHFRGVMFSNFKQNDWQSPVPLSSENGGFLTIVKTEILSIQQKNTLTLPKLYVYQIHAFTVHAIRN